MAKNQHDNEQKSEELQNVEQTNEELEKEKFFQKRYDKQIGIYDKIVFIGFKHISDFPIAERTEVCYTLVRYIRRKLLL